jgi:putative DNA primase/helicase
MADRPSPSDLAARLAGRVGTLAVHLMGEEPTSRSGNGIRFRAKGSLAVAVSGPKRGSWHDHEAGKGGDALGLVAHLLGVPMKDAYRWALDWLGEGPGPKLAHVAPASGEVRHGDAPLPRVTHGGSPSPTLDLARRIWREAVPAAGTPVETYLASRGLRLPDVPVLRFHPECQRGAEVLPAMVALMTDAANGQGCGVHRTFLRAGGTGKAEGNAKMMLGNVGVIRLVPDAEVTTGLGLAEGIETALSVMQVFGWSPVWAATSAGAIRRFPILPSIECLTIFADADAPGQEAALEAAARWTEEGREALVVAPPRGDWNDAARGVAA